MMWVGSIGGICKRVQRLIVETNKPCFEVGLVGFARRKESWHESALSQLARIVRNDLSSKPTAVHAAEFRVKCRE